MTSSPLPIRSLISSSSLPLPLRPRLSAGTSSTPVLAIAVPFKLEDGVPASPPSYLAPAASSKPAIVLSATFSTSSPAAIDALAWALGEGYTVNVDCQSGLTEESGWDALEEFLTKATANSGVKGKIVLCECPSVWLRHGSMSRMRWCCAWRAR